MEETVRFAEHRKTKKRIGHAHFKSGKEKKEKKTANSVGRRK